jgi:hypothetical protein
MRYVADPPRIEEIVASNASMATASRSAGSVGLIVAPIVVLWQAGLPGQRSRSRRPSGSGIVQTGDRFARQSHPLSASKHSVKQCFQSPGMCVAESVANSCRSCLIASILPLISG